MTNKSSKAFTYLSHPFTIILAVIVIAYGGYLFGQWLYDVYN